LRGRSPLNGAIFKEKNKSGAEIAKELNIPTTTLYSTEGWKNRNNPNYLDKFS